MNTVAKLAWGGLEFRKPAMLRIVEPLSEEQMRWCPPNRGNSISWQLWHIAEVEDNWVRALLHGQPKRYPFGRSVKIASPDQYPGEAELLEYFHEVREISRIRLEETTETDFERTVRDDHFGGAYSRSGVEWNHYKFCLARRAHRADEPALGLRLNGRA